MLRVLMARLDKEQPLRGIHLSGCLHITTETANLARTLKAAGAEVVLCASNPLSTQDDVAAALVETLWHSRVCGSRRIDRTLLPAYRCGA